MTSIVLAFLVCFVISAISLIIAFYSLGLLLVDAVASAIWSGFGIPKLLCLIISLVGFLLPFIVFPVTAYFVSPLVYELRYDADTTSEILFVFAGFPYLLLPIPIIYILWLCVGKNSQ